LVIVITSSKAHLMSIVCHVHQYTAGLPSTRNITVSEEGEVYVWGNTPFYWGSDAHRAAAARGVPSKLVNLLKAIMVACGRHFSVVVCENGSLWTWGVEWGTGHARAERRPTEIQRQTFSSAVAMILCGDTHAVALRATGQVWTCGDGGDGALGHGDLRVFTGVQALGAADAIFLHNGCHR